MASYNGGNSIFIRQMDKETSIAKTFITKLENWFLLKGERAHSLYIFLYARL